MSESAASYLSSKLSTIYRDHLFHSTDAGLRQKLADFLIDGCKAKSSKLIELIQA